MWTGGVSRAGGSETGSFGSETSVTDPVRDGIFRRFRDLKLNGPLRLLLHDCRSGTYSIAMRDVAHSQFDQVAGPELAVDRQIKKREIANPRGELQADAYRPDLLELERGFLADELGLVPGFPLLYRNVDVVHVRLLSVEGATVWAAIQRANTDVLLGYAA